MEEGEEEGTSPERGEAGAAGDVSGGGVKRGEGAPEGEDDDARTIEIGGAEDDAARDVRLCRMKGEVFFAKLDVRHLFRAGGRDRDRDRDEKIKIVTSFDLKTIK
jgi:hypothetical protein